MQAPVADASRRFDASVQDLARNFNLDAAEAEGKARAALNEKILLLETDISS